MSIHNCCQNCEKRHFNCHSTCNDYIQAKQDYQKIKDKQIAERRERDFFMSTSRFKKYYDKKK